MDRTATLNTLNTLRNFTFGFDNLFDQLLENSETNVSFPPFNIIRVGETVFILEFALAGYAREDISVTLDGRLLSVESKKTSKQVDTYASEDKSVYVVHKGISSKQFNRTFTVAENVVVKEAKFVEGLLVITLEQIVPDEKKPKVISIK